MIKRKTLRNETPRAQSLSERQAALDVRKAAALTRTDFGKAYRAQVLAEIAVMEADLAVEIDMLIMTEELAEAQAVLDAAAAIAEDAVAATSCIGLA